GALPTGVSLNASTGAITGTPALAGNFAFTIKVTDGSAQSQTANTSISVVAAPLQISTTTSNTTATSGGSFSLQFVATGGVPPYTFSLASGTLPAGLTLNPSTGLLSGTP